MNTILNVTAIYRNDDEKQIFLFLKSYFNYLFNFQIIDTKTSINDRAVILFSFDDMKQSEEHLIFTFDKDNSEKIIISHDMNQDISQLMSLTKQLTTFYLKQVQRLDYFPLPYHFYDKKGYCLYSNQDKDSSIFLESWIAEQLELNPNHQLLINIPSSSFDQILIQHFQSLFNDDNQLEGTISQVIDLKPLLETYLEDSGQALVGWSDTTSGASISN